MKIHLKSFLLAGSIAFASLAQANAISGAGATFPQPVYATWADAYHQQTQNQVNYQGIGSGGGINQIKAGTVAFGATDAALTATELKDADLVQFPTVIGAIVPIVNIEGVEAGQLDLSGSVLADIYLGKISKWNDPKIAALNPNIDLPDSKIITVYRADGSGTSYNFTSYLSQISEDWKNGPGASKSPNWPTAGKSGVGGKGNPGVAIYVKKTPNTIGYVEYAFAKNGLAFTKMTNKAGQVVKPNQESFKAAGNADWASAEGFNLTIANASNDPKAWPMVAATFILVPAHPEDINKTQAALDFFAWAYANGDTIAEKLSYVPFTAKNKALFKKSWQQVVGKDGQPLFDK